MSSLGVLLTLAAAAMAALAALIAFDKLRPLRTLDDQPEPPAATGSWLGDGDLEHHLNLRNAAESRLHRRTSR